MDAPRIDKQEVRRRIDDPDAVIIDVRRHQENETEKIKGSVYEDPDRVSEWAGKYDRGKTVILYCS